MFRESKRNVSVSCIDNKGDEELLYSEKKEDIIISKIDLLNDKNNNDAIDCNQRKRCPFSKEEDDSLLSLVRFYGLSKKNAWYLIASHMKNRNARQCRERYQLYLSESVRKKAKWSKEEDDMLLFQYSMIGPHWKKMEDFFVGRTSYNIKNRFKSLIRSKEPKSCSIINMSSNVSISSINNDDIQTIHDQNPNSKLQIQSTLSYSSQEEKSEEFNLIDHSSSMLFDFDYQPELMYDF